MFVSGTDEDSSKPGAISNEPSDGGEYSESSLEEANGFAPLNGEKLLGGDSETSGPKDDGSGDTMVGSDKLCEVAGRYNGSLVAAIGFVPPNGE